MYAGLRMSADEYLSLEDDGFKYELLDGVVIVSPSPTPQHQQVLAEILFQLKAFLRDHAVGNVYPETDVRLDDKLVYRPELVFVRAERVAANWQRIREAPDVIVEVVSPSTRRYDLETKKPDYERYGVGEYWLVDPERDSMTFFRLEDGRFVKAKTAQDRYESRVIAGFALDLAAVRKSFRPS